MFVRGKAINGYAPQNHQSSKTMATACDDTDYEAMAVIHEVGEVNVRPFVALGNRGKPQRTFRLSSGSIRA